MAISNIYTYLCDYHVETQKVRAAYTLNLIAKGDMASTSYTRQSIALVMIPYVWIR